MNLTLLYGFLSLISGMICAGIAMYLAPYRDKIGARQLMLLMASISIWTLGYGMEFLSPDLSLKLWWVRVEYMGVAWVGMLLFTFICIITGKTYCQRKRIKFLLSIIPVLTILLVLTNEFHGLMWHEARLESNSVIQGIIYERESAFWWYVAFSYGLIFWATLMLVKAFLSSRGIYRKQLTVILCGIMVPWLCNVLYLFGFQALFKDSASSRCCFSENILSTGVSSSVTIWLISGNSVVTSSVAVSAMISSSWRFEISLCQRHSDCPGHWSGHELF